jgi:MATE family multidrug resistance protein
MRSSVNSLAVITGITTPLETFCSHAWGSNRFKYLVIYLQKYFFHSLLAIIPVYMLWFLWAKAILLKFLHQDGSVISYILSHLKIISLGLLGYEIYGGVKSFLQAQCQFSATSYILLFISPINFVLHAIYFGKFRWDMLAFRFL